MATGGYCNVRSGGSSRHIIAHGVRGVEANRDLSAGKPTRGAAILITSTLLTDLGDGSGISAKCHSWPSGFQLYKAKCEE